MLKKQKLGFEDEQKPKGPNGLNQNSAIRASWSKINTGGSCCKVEEGARYKVQWVRISGFPRKGPL